LIQAGKPLCFFFLCASTAIAGFFVFFGISQSLIQNNKYTSFCVSSFPYLPVYFFFFFLPKKKTMHRGHGTVQSCPVVICDGLVWHFHLWYVWLGLWLVFRTYFFFGLFCYLLFVFFFLKKKTHFHYYCTFKHRVPIAPKNPLFLGRDLKLYQRLVTQWI
jgi:hypothetical protein